ncbi:hypothetical protein KKE60_04895, partial [Patescibacteria group bacterium]|nr:hypothetical protein [Patescibacteria group bacterium]
CAFYPCPGEKGFKNEQPMVRTPKNPLVKTPREMLPNRQPISIKKVGMGSATGTPSLQTVGSRGTVGSPDLLKRAILQALRPV